MVIAVELQHSIKLRKSHIWNIFGKNKRKFMFQSLVSMVHGTTKHTIVYILEKLRFSREVKQLEL